MQASSFQRHQNWHPLPDPKHSRMAEFPPVSGPIPFTGGEVEMLVQIQKHLLKEAQSLAFCLLTALKHLLHVLHVAGIVAVQLLQHLLILILALQQEHSNGEMLPDGKKLLSTLAWDWQVFFPSALLNKHTKEIRRNPTAAVPFHCCSNILASFLFFLATLFHTGTSTLSLLWTDKPAIFGSQVFSSIGSAPCTKSPTLLSFFILNLFIH